MNKARALPVDVFRASHSDCTNGGISSKFNQLLVLCKDGFKEVDLDNPPQNLVQVVRREFAGRYTYHLEPVAEPTGAGWMMGGNYAATSDSRFSRMIGNMYGAVSIYDVEDLAVAIHDRQETWEQYDMLSR